MSTNDSERNVVVSDSQPALGAHPQATVKLAGAEEAPVWLLEAIGPGFVRTMVAEGEAIEVGSGPASTMRLADATVSTRHARVSVRDGRLLVDDLGSSNGLYAGGSRVTTADVAPGACIVVGRTAITCAPFHARHDGGAFAETPLEGVVGESLAMRALARQVRKVAPLRAPVLIQGETGSGKDVIARALHRLSGPRARGELVCINMGSLAPEIADSELFGHERGAFTSAVVAKRGAFEEARDGTLFLDEIAELALTVQAKLLRALESSEIRPVGAARTRHVDTRVLAATWADLGARVAEGRFREDLLHRIGVLRVHVPALRERRGDIAALALVFLKAHSAEMGASELSLTSCGLSRLVSHEWPGNVRELRNVLLRAAVDAGRGHVSSRHIAAALCDQPIGKPPQRSAAHAVDRSARAREALDASGGNISAASRVLGVERSTVRAWLGRSGRAR